MNFYSIMIDALDSGSSMIKLCLCHKCNNHYQPHSIKLHFSACKVIFFAETDLGQFDDGCLLNHHSGAVLGFTLFAQVEACLHGVLCLTLEQLQRVQIRLLRQCLAGRCQAVGGEGVDGP